MHQIYVIGPLNGPYKIGYSADPQSRLLAIQTGCDSPIKMWASSPSITPREHERAIHLALAAHRMDGEWFSCPLDEIFAAMSSSGLDIEVVLPTHTQGWMNGGAFKQWLAEMRKPPFFATEQTCAEMLGVPRDAISVYQSQGADLRTALACRALLHRMDPYS